MNEHGSAHDAVHDDDRLGVGSAIVSCVFALIIGGVVGLITTFAHAQLPPWGLLAGLAIVLALVIGFRLVFASRLVGAAAAVGFLVGCAVLVLPAAGAPILVVSGPIGWIWVVGPAVLAVAALVLPWRRRAVDRP